MPATADNPVRLYQRLSGLADRVLKRSFSAEDLLQGEFRDTDSQVVIEGGGALPSDTVNVALPFLQTRNAEEVDTLSAVVAESGTVVEPRNRLRSRDVIQVRPSAPAKKRLIPLQQWEGVVTGLTDDTVFGELRDITELSHERELVEFERIEIPDADRSLLVEGAVFYWSIGYEESNSGQLRRVSEFRMRRLPEWTKRRIAKLHEDAADLFNRIKKRAKDGGSGA